MPIERIDKLGDSRLDVFARLTEAQLRNRLEPEKGIFIAESDKVITRALDAGYILESMLMDERLFTRSHNLFARVSQLNPEIPLFILPSAEIEQLTGFELTRGVIAAFKRPELSSVEELVDNSKRIAVLEGIVDHTNVGAIFRSAAALNVDAVLVTPTCCDPLYRRAVRVSMGTVFQVPWTRIGEDVADWSETGLSKLHNLGVKTAAFALSEKAISLDDPQLAACERLALIFGTEGDGLSSRTIQGCDFEVCIHMRQGVDSLNVAAASAVAFWQLCR